MTGITLKHALVGIIFAFIFYIFSINYQLTISNIKLIYKPTFYHGEQIKKNFFEGWYYKTVTSNAEGSLIVIPGIYKSTSQSDEESHAFVMIIRDGYECLYYRYNISEFNVENSDSNNFTIRIGQSKFSEDTIELSLPSTRLVPSTDIEYESYTDLVIKDWSKLLGSGSDSLKSSIIKHPFVPYSVRGIISFNNTTPYPFAHFSPTIMGPFAYIPFLECNHGVISMSHRTFGMIEFVNMKYNGIVENRMDLENGFGYIEKDWGINFPKSWIWSQSNTFISEMKEEKSSSILISIADFPLISPDNPLYKIPYLENFLSLFHLAGRIIVFYHAKSDITYNFSTYIFFSKLVDLEINMNDFTMQYVKLHVVNTKDGLNLEINIKRKAGIGIPLRAPSKQFGKMTLMVEESLNAELLVKLWKYGEDSKEEVIFNDRAVAGGLEIVGDVMWLVNKHGENSF